MKIPYPRASLFLLVLSHSLWLSWKVLSWDFKRAKKRKLNHTKGHRFKKDLKGKACQHGGCEC